MVPPVVETVAVPSPPPLPSPPLPPLTDVWNFLQSIWNFLPSIWNFLQSIWYWLPYAIVGTLIIIILFLDFVVLEELDLHLRYERYWWVSILIIPIVMLLATFGIMSIVKGALLGAILLLALRKA